MQASWAIESFARPDARSVPPYNAGLSAEVVRARYGVARIAKLGSNENPLGPAAAVATALAAAPSVALYPDAGCGALRAALAARLALDPARLVFGNGSEDLIAVLSRVLLDHGDEVVTITPAFGLHVICPQSLGATVRCVPVRPDWAIDVDGLIAALTPRTRLLMLSNPSNPVGSALDAREFERLLAALPAHTLLVWDEAYHEYAAADPGYPDCLALLEGAGHPFVLLRTFSKAYALAGLRVGYGICSEPALAALIDRLRNPFNVNALAQAAALAALADRAHLHASVQHVVEERERVRGRLIALGLAPAPSLANFLFFDCGHDAAALGERLLRRGVITKPWREPGYTRCLRVSIGSRDDNDLFLDALDGALGEMAHETEG